MSDQDPKDPTGMDDDIFGLSDGTGDDDLFGDLSSSPESPDDGPKATADPFGGEDPFGLEERTSAPDGGGDEFIIDVNSDTPEPKESEESSDTTLSDNDLSLIGNYQRNRSTVAYHHDEVFGAEGKPAAPTSSKSSDGPGSETTSGENPFGQAAQKDREPLDLGRDREAAPAAPAAPADTSDPFASLGNVVDDAPPQATENLESESVDFSSLLAGNEEDPFAASGADESFSSPFGEEDGNDDPFSIPQDEDTFFVEAADVGSEDTLSLEPDGGTAFKERPTSSFKIGKESKKANLSKGSKIGIAFIALIGTFGVVSEYLTEWGWFGLDLLYPPREKVVTQAPVVQPPPKPTKQGATADTTNAFLEEIAEKEKELRTKPQDNDLKNGLLAAHMNFRNRFPVEYDVNKKAFKVSLEQLKREVGLEAAPRLEALDLIHSGDLDKAKAALDQALAAESKNAPIQFLYGKIAYEEGDLDKALSWFGKAVQNDPDMLKAVFFQGEILEAKAKYDQASEKYLKVLRANPAHNTARLGLVRVRIATGDLTGAEQLANQALAEAAAQKNSEDQYLAHKVLAQVNKQLNNPQKRLDHLEASFNFKPTDSESVVELLDHYIHEKNMEKVEGILLSAVNKGCTGPAFYDRLVTYFMKADMEQAETYANFGIDSHPNNALVHILRGKVAAKKGHLKNARSYYTKAIEVEPTASSGYIALSEIQHQARRSEAAARVLSEGVEANPGASDLLVALAKLYSKTAQVIKAKSIFEKILEKDPSNTRIRLSYAMLLTDIGYAEEAITQFQTLFSQGLTDNQATVGFAHALSRAQRPREAISQLNGLLTIQPQNVVANTQMGSLHIELQSFKTAENHLRAALRVEPNHAPAFFELGRLGIATDKPEEAAQNLQRAVELIPENLGYRFELASALAARPKTRKDARRNLDQIIEQYENMSGAKRATRNPNTYRLRGDLFFQSGDYGKALKDYEQAMLIDTSNLEAISGLAVTLFKLNRVKEAEAYFREILSKDRANSEAHYYLGRVAHNRGNDRKAEEHLLAAVQQGDTKFADAHKTLGYMFRERKMSAPAKRHLTLYLKQGDPTSEERAEVQRILTRIR